MTAIPALGAAFQVLAMEAKQSPFPAAENSGSFAALLDAGEMQIASERQLVIRANVRDDFSTHSLAQQIAANSGRLDAVPMPSVHANVPQEVPSIAAAPLPSSMPAIAQVANIEPTAQEQTVPDTAPRVVTNANLVALPSQPLESDAPILTNTTAYHVRRLPKLFAFMELGMFGRHAAQFESAAQASLSDAKGNISGPRTITASIAQFTSGGSSAGVQAAPKRMLTFDCVSQPTFSAVVPMPQQSGGQYVQMSPLGDFVSAAETEFATAEHIADADSQKGSAAPQIANLGSVAEAKSPTSTESEFLPVEEGSAAPPLPELPESRAPSPLNIVVSGLDNALVIVARSNDAEIESAQLRRLAESAANEFGMHVMEVRINGSAVEPSLASGGNDGRRAR